MVAELELNKERSGKYRSLAAAFSYPDKKFFEFFPELSAQKEKLTREYDQLFRAKEIWLYGTEYMSEHEFQRSNYLADISGFYRAFGVESDGDRPDSLAAELEFMHYLIFKEINAPDAAKAEICADAQKKFFTGHLAPMASPLAKKIIAQAPDGFYKGIAEELSGFLAQEDKFLSQ